MMEFLIINIIVPIVAGVFVDFIIKRFETQVETMKARLLPLIIGVLVALIMFFGLLFIPPVKIDGVTWCSNQDKSIRINGRITTSLLSFSVAGESVQVKVFEAGKSDPLGPRFFTTTNAQGIFSDNMSQVSLTNNSAYVINIAYSYSRFILGERWQISDFNQGVPSACSQGE